MGESSEVQNPDIKGITTWVKVLSYKNPNIKGISSLVKVQGHHFMGESSELLKS